MAVQPLPPPPAMLPGLPGAFLAYLTERSTILESIRYFQWSHRGRFLGGQAGDEYTLEQMDSHKSFLALVDHHLSPFLAEVGATDDDFAAAMLDMKHGQDPHWQAFDLLLQRVDFESFAALLRANVCLCCGGQFLWEGPSPPPSSQQFVQHPPPAGDVGEEPPSGGDDYAGLDPREVAVSMQEQPAAVVEVDVTVPMESGEGQAVMVDYGGQRYQVLVPQGSLPGSVFRVALQVASHV